MTIHALSYLPISKETDMLFDLSSGFVGLPNAGAFKPDGIAFL